jgi:transcriptional regulator with XRE-family HTH domain
LAQTDLAFILGDRTSSRVSRYERAHRLPPLEVALALEAIFGIAVTDLFRGSYAEIVRRVKRRARELLRGQRPRNGILAVRRQRSIEHLLDR